MENSCVLCLMVNHGLILVAKSLLIFLGKARFPIWAVLSATIACLCLSTLFRWIGRHFRKYSVTVNANTQPSESSRTAHTEDNEIFTTVANCDETAYQTAISTADSGNRR